MAEWLSKLISSRVLMRRASDMSACPSTTLIPSFCGANHRRGHGAAQHGDSGTRPLSEPGTMQLVVFRGRPKIPQNRLVILREECEAIRFVLGPSADVGRGQVADIVHVEAQESAH